MGSVWLPVIGVCPLLVCLVDGFGPRRVPDGCAALQEFGLSGGRPCLGYVSRPEVVSWRLVECALSLSVTCEACLPREFPTCGHAALRVLCSLLSAISVFQVRENRS